MNRQGLKDEIIFKLTSGVLQCELDDRALEMIINSSIREIQRYIDSTKLVTIAYSRCIDMTQYKVSSVSRVFRAKGFQSDTSTTGGVTDPLLVSQWQLISGGGNLANFTSYAYDYASWNTLLQIRNTTSTDLIFKYDKSSEKLYINVSSNYPDQVTVEYVPILEDVSDIVSDFWIDFLVRLCVANAKIAVGTIRTRYTQGGNALWSQDGEKKLEEGNAELTAIREALQKATWLTYPID